MRFDRLAWLMWALLVACAIGLPRIAAAALQVDAEGCQALAQLVSNAATVRDLGADKAKHIALAERQLAGSPELLKVVRRELERVYTSQATPEALGEMTLQRCYAARGLMEDES